MGLIGSIRIRFNVGISSMIRATITSNTPDSKTETVLEIYEGDIVNFTLPGHTHGPETEIYKNEPVWWDEESTGFVFGKKNTMMDGRDFIHMKSKKLKLSETSMRTEICFHLIRKWFEGNRIRTRTNNADQEAVVG